MITVREEYEENGIGIDKLMDEGKLESMKNGPVYWVDSSDRNPCIGKAQLCNDYVPYYCKNLIMTKRIVNGKKE